MSTFVDEDFVTAERVQRKTPFWISWTVLSLLFDALKKDKKLAMLKRLKPGGVRQEAREGETVRRNRYFLKLLLFSLYMLANIYLFVGACLLL